MTTMGRSTTDAGGYTPMNTNPFSIGSIRVRTLEVTMYFVSNTYNNSEITLYRMHLLVKTTNSLLPPSFNCKALICHVTLSVSCVS